MSDVSLCDTNIMELLATGEGDRDVAQLIDVKIAASLFHQKGFKEGETLVISPRKARVFLQQKFT